MAPRKVCLGGASGGVYCHCDVLWPAGGGHEGDRPVSENRKSSLLGSRFKLSDSAKVNERLQSRDDAESASAGIWPVVIGDETKPAEAVRKNGRLSLNTKAFLIMGGTGLAAAFTISPLILLFDGITAQTYVLLGCLMALASFIAGVANYQIVLRGVQGLVVKLVQRGTLLQESAKPNGKRPINHGEIDTVDSLITSLLDKVSAGEEAQVRLEQDALFSAISSLAAALEARDPYTRTHSRNVARFSGRLAGKMGLDDADIDEIQLAGQLHDIGKIGIRDEILLKPGSLTGDEFIEIKRHPELSVNILRPFRYLDNVRAAIRHHHEKMNGSGYPDGLKGEDIPLGARIMAVVDVFDAMTSDRPYRPALDFDEAMMELERMSGPELDPECVEAFLELVEEDPDLAMMRTLDLCH